MRLHLIVNPHSGAGRGPAVRDAVLSRFKSAGARVDIHETRHAGHAEELANRVDLGGYDGLCAIGGDGTMHELVNGLLGRTDGMKAPIGLIAGGTGNSLMRDLECLDPGQAVKRILSGNRRGLDIARVEAASESFYSFNIVGWGLPTAVKKTSMRLGWLRGQQYNVATVIEVLKNTRRRARISIDGRAVDGEYEFLLGCNTVHTGMGMKIAPRARIDDGLIDLVIARHAGRLKTLSLFPKIFNGSHVDDPIVEYHQARAFTIEPDTDDMLNVDGELKGRSPVRVTMMPGAVELLA